MEKSIRRIVRSKLAITAEAVATGFFSHAESVIPDLEPLTLFVAEIQIWTPGQLFLDSDASGLFALKKES